ncbi:hypothetical protein FKR81_17155 [Lentzea tibetensis]|uniref:Uncharacterized protein n=1 Tax=Lentzea tibetensis TaxID=2591470 RepID=A0A563EW09_9PSEU|nr:hypothetical protein [Lentzea tibetensis]TWP51334.1 hypothetical protein FKR81_17155 [Lentzea tibetensis]
MSQQHDVPPAFLRVWWRVPTWSRMLPVVCGSLLAPIALVSFSSPPPSGQAPDIANPAVPSTTPQTPPVQPAAVNHQSPKNTRTTTTGDVPASSSPAATPSSAATEPAVPSERPAVTPRGIVLDGAPCSYQGETATAFASSGPVVCVVTRDGTLRWRKS